MYALTGNYKTDQVHVPALLERLGQIERDDAGIAFAPHMPLAAADGCWSPSRWLITVYALLLRRARRLGARRWPSPCCCSRWPIR